MSGSDSHERPFLQLLKDPEHLVGELILPDGISPEMPGRLLELLCTGRLIQIPDNLSYEEASRILQVHAEMKDNPSFG